MGKLTLPPNVLVSNIRSPLVPGTSYLTEIQLLPLTAGPLHLEAIKLVDLNTNDSRDIRDLPDVVALDEVRVSQ